MHLVPNIPDSKTSWRLPDRNDPVVAAMAADDAMLALATQGIATFRIYSWDGPHLSLGYFQTESLRSAMGHSPPDDARPWARRSTGGEALLHHHEWTYAFALPPGHPLAEQASNLPLRIHEAIALGLKTLGYPATLHEGIDHYVDRSGLCFQHFTPGDLLVGGHKVMGSAQRKRKGAVLQHGGLLFKKSEVESRLPGLADIQPGLRIPGGEDLARWISSVIGPIEPSPESLLADWEKEHQLCLAQHQSPEWLCKR